MQRKISILYLIIVLISLPIKTAYTQPSGLNLEYFNLIQQKLNSSFIYPQKAKIKGWEGIAKVKFTVVQDGRIKKIEVAESSGYPLLDAAAILAIKDASPYPFPKKYRKKELEIILPVSYKQSELVTVSSSKETKPGPSYPKTIPVLSKKVATPAQVSLKATPDEFSSFMELALKNNQPTQVAFEEIKFAQLKVAEARRNLFPALKLSAYSTQGEVYKIDYEERENKIQLDQPLFYGMRLGNTFKQAKVNLEITQKNYDRLKFDVMQKTETAYYNLIAAKINFGKQEALIAEAKDMLEKIEKLANAGMVIPLELTSARSWFKQMEFQLDNIKQDMLMAELTFTQVLNVKEAPVIKTQTLEAKKINLNLDNCLALAFKYRPEIYLSKLLMQFNDYSKKIENAKSNAFTVDLTGSYGNYEGAYKTEPMRNADNWSVGIKVSKPWGANTLNTSYTTEKSQPRIGQTSATASSTISNEFNLLDNLRRLADKKRSDIDLQRSLSDFNETLKTINFEVQDALLNYQKALLQLNTAQNEIQFRRNELDITKIRAMVGEVSLSNAMSLIVNLSEAQTKYTQALANYHISLANFKKATGYGIKI